MGASVLRSVSMGTSTCTWHSTCRADSTASSQCIEPTILPISVAAFAVPPSETTYSTGQGEATDGSVELIQCLGICVMTLLNDRSVQWNLFLSRACMFATDAVHPRFATAS